MLHVPRTTNPVPAATAFAPATVSNVACGFDVLGFAIEGPGDAVTVRAASEPGVRVVSVSGAAGAEALPTDAERNTAGVAVARLVEAVGQNVGFTGGVEVTVEKRMPFGSGLGSSAASAVAGAVAANALLGSPLAREALMPFALDGEAVASGGRHADNVAPSLLGGFVLVRTADDVVRLPVPDGLSVAVVHPHVQVLTAEARAALGAAVPMRAFVEQTANLGALVAGLFTSDLDLVGRALRDAVVEPQRVHLVPRFAEMQSAAMRAGALGCSLSGSGPSVFALCRTRRDAERAGAAMQAALGDAAASTVYVSAVGEGARVS